MSTITTENKYVIDSMKTLIDLNEDKKDFELTFEIIGDKKFMFTVVDQTILDDTPKLSYEEGIHVTKSIKHVNKPFQNYFLVLKSLAEEDVNVKIKINLTDLSGVNQISDDRKALIDRRLEMDDKDVDRHINNSKSDSNLISYLLITLILILIIVYIYQKTR